MASLSGKVIWITGASSGIGEALAYELAREGAKLILSSRRRLELERVKGNCVASSQPDVRLLTLDLSRQETFPLLTEAAIQLFGHVDILINNGGIRQRSLAKDTSIDTDRNMMDINYFGAVGLTKSLLPYFVKRKSGHFVTVSSITGKFGTPYRSAYSASKHALHGFYDSLRAELYRDAGKDISVTLICPGFIDTPDQLTTPQPQERKYSKMPADVFAKKMVRAIERKKEEVYIGGNEVRGVYLKRWLPGILSRMIRKAAVH